MSAGGELVTVIDDAFGGVHLSEVAVEVVNEIGVTDGVCAGV